MKTEDGSFWSRRIMAMLTPIRALLSSEISETKAMCPQCNRMVPGVIVEKNGVILLRRRCSDHGVSESVLSHHSRWYRAVEALLGPRPEPEFAYEPARAENVRGVFLDLTDRCNLGCPNCLADANPVQREPEPSLDAVLSTLRTMTRHRPVIYLTGGEPTLRKDLLAWIATLRAEGYTVKLLSNGLRLVDRDYCRAIRDAGVSWVLLQFDSTREESLRRLRDRTGLAQVRRRALSNLSELGMNVDLACMIDPQSNLSEVGELVRLGFQTPGVRHVSLMPARRIGRGHLTTDENFLDEFELMKALEQQTAHAISPRDWLMFLAFCAAVYRLTGDPDFTPRRCFLALPLVGTAEQFFPVTRPWKYLHDLSNVVALVRMASRFGRIEAARWSERTLLISIETFRELPNLDIGDAARCTRYYLVGQTLRQACLYNLLGRSRLRDRETTLGIAR